MEKCWPGAGLTLACFQLDWWHVGSPTVRETIKERGFIWVMSLETFAHNMSCFDFAILGKITFQWLGPGVSWRLPPPPPLPSVIFLARQGCYPKLELKSVLELCCHVFDIISFQHSCAVDRCMDCNLLCLHYMSHIHIPAITTISNMHAPTHWICGSCDGWITCETSSGTSYCPTSMAWVIRKTASSIDLTPGIIIPISGVLIHDQMESRFPDLLHQLSTLSLVPE